MAKKKSKGGRKPSVLGPKSERLVMLCRPEYRTWLEKRLAVKKLAFPEYVEKLIAADAAVDGAKPPPTR